MFKIDRNYFYFCSKIWPEIHHILVRFEDLSANIKIQVFHKFIKLLFESYLKFHDIHENDLGVTLGISNSEFEKYNINFNPLKRIIQNCSWSAKTTAKKRDTLQLDIFHTVYELIFEPMLNSEGIISILNDKKAIDFEVYSKKIKKLKKSDSLISQGTIYTPEFLAEFMVKESFHNLDFTPINQLRILDLCSGTGCFILKICDYLCQLDFEPEEILINNITAVDSDICGILILKIQLLLWFIENNSNNMINFERIAKIINSKILHTDVLENDFSLNNLKFDFIISNPPYISEKSNKILIDRILQNPSNNKYYMPRMDFYLFFLGKSFELIEKGGIITFLSPNYFLRNDNGKKIRLKIHDDVKSVEFYDFGRINVFKNAPGHHSAFYILKIKQYKDDDKQKQFNYKQIKNESEFRREFSYLNSAFKTEKYDLDSVIIKEDDYKIILGEKELSSIPFFPKGKNFIKLRELASVRQGIIAGIDRLNSKNLILLSKDKNTTQNYTMKEGIFVLSNKELENLPLNEKEKELILPFDYPRNFIQHSLFSLKNSFEPEFNIIYTDRNSFLTKNEYPNLLTHLSRFKKIMDLRRETRLGNNVWYQLHWPRRRDLFTNPRLISIRMTKKPNIIYSDIPFVTDLSTNIINSNLKAIHFIFFALSSEYGEKWLKKYAKNKGDLLQIDGRLLENFPLPRPNDKILFVFQELMPKLDEEMFELFQKYNNKIFYEMYEQNSDSALQKLSLIFSYDNSKENINAFLKKNQK